MTQFLFQVRRYFPVANLTRTRQAVLIEPLRPDRFMVRTFNATSLYILSICEVCGSYQCPYCPFYSGAEATGIVMTPLLFAALLAAVLYLGQ
jgi:CD109 antigen